MAAKQETPYYCGPASLVRIQQLLGYKKVMTQSEWAYVAKTTTKGTSIANLKRCILLMAPGYEIIRKTEEIFEGLSIVYDAKRDHWMVADCLPYLYEAHLYDPLDGSEVILDWEDFQKKFLNSKTNSYALWVKRGYF